MCEVLGINRLVPVNPVNRSYRCFDQDLTLAAEAEQPPGRVPDVPARSVAAAGRF